VPQIQGGLGFIGFDVDASDIERFTSQLRAELHAIGAFLHYGEVGEVKYIKGKGLSHDGEIKRVIRDLPFDILYADFEETTRNKS